MKKLISIFVLLICIGFKHIDAQAEQTLATQQLFEFGKYDNDCKKRSSFYHFDTKNSEKFKKKFKTKKKRRPRGIETARHCTFPEYFCFVFASKKGLIFSLQKQYFPLPFFSNGKRGPPAN